MHLLPCRSYLPTWGLSSHGSLATSWYVILFLFVCVYTVTFHHLLFYFHALNLFIMLLFICAFTSCVFPFVICFVFSCDRWLVQSVLRSKSTALCFNSYFILFYHMLLFYSYAFLICIYYFMICALHFLSIFCISLLYALLYSLCPLCNLLRMICILYLIIMICFLLSFCNFSFLHFICCILLSHMVLRFIIHFLIITLCI